MITMTLSTDAVRKALIQYIQTDLNMNVAGKDIDVSVIVGRKSADKPTPDVTATISISDSTACTPSNSLNKAFAEAKLGAEITKANPLGEPDTVVSKEEKQAIAEPDFSEDDVEIPRETPETVFGEIEAECSADSSSSLFGR